MLSMSLQFCIFLGFLIVILIITKYLNKIKLGQFNSNDTLKIISMLNLSSNAHLFVVKYEKDKFFLSVTNNEIKVINQKEII